MAGCRWIWGSLHARACSSFLRQSAGGAWLWGEWARGPYVRGAAGYLLLCGFEWELAAGRDVWGFWWECGIGFAAADCSGSGFLWGHAQGQILTAKGAKDGRHGRLENLETQRTRRTAAEGAEEDFLPQRTRRDTECFIWMKYSLGCAIRWLARKKCGPVDSFLKILVWRESGFEGKGEFGLLRTARTKRDLVQWVVMQKPHL